MGTGGSVDDLGIGRRFLRLSVIEIRALYSLQSRYYMDYAIADLRRFLLFFVFVLEKTSMSTTNWCLKVHNAPTGC